jgi:hypothetical protein
MTDDSANMVNGSAWVRLRRRRVPDYDEVFGPIRAAHQAKDGNQIGDPARAAQALPKLLDSDNPRSILCSATTPCA